MRRSTQIQAPLLLTSLALVGCGEQPVQMNDKNVPKFKTQTECVQRYGQENCRTGTHSGGGSFFYPNYTTGQTYFYPSRGGYYQGASFGTAIGVVTDAGNIHHLTSTGTLCARRLRRDRGGDLDRVIE
jgi:hypothetical protein